MVADGVHECLKLIRVGVRPNIRIGVWPLVFVVFVYMWGLGAAGYQVVEVGDGVSLLV